MTDPMAERFQKKEKQHKLEDLSIKARKKEDVKAEKELIEKTKKVDPIHVENAPGRNDPCPCGSGKKYKKCCGAGKE